MNEIVNTFLLGGDKFMPKIHLTQPRFMYSTCGQFIKKFKKRKVHSTFIDNIWVAGLAELQLISKFNKGFRILLCVIDIYSKYARVIPLKDKKGITITNASQKMLDELKRKPNKMWVDKGIEFYNTSMNSWLETNDIEMCIQCIMKENLLLLKDSLEH